MPAHYDINVMSIFVEMGGFEKSDSHVIKPKSQLAPRQCVIVDALPGCSKAELKPGERKKGVAEESERQGHQNASPR